MIFVDILIKKKKIYTEKNDQSRTLELLLNKLKKKSIQNQILFDYFNILNHKY